MRRYRDTGYHRYVDCRKDGLLIVLEDERRKLDHLPVGAGRLEQDFC